MSKLEAKNIQYGQSFVIGSNEAMRKRQAALQEAELIIAAAKAEAEKIMEEARAKSLQKIGIADVSAKETIEQARLEVEKIKDTARADGIDIGRQEGVVAVTAEMEDKILMVDTFAEVNFEIKKKIIKSAHKDIVGLVTTIAEKIGLNALKNSDEFLTELTLQAINLLPEKEAVNIIINPSLAERIYAISPELKEKVTALENIKIIEDSAISDDGPIVEGIKSRVDARITSQIYEITTKLTAHLMAKSDDEILKELED